MRNFNECPFRVSLPKLSKEGKSITLVFEISSRLLETNTVAFDAMNFQDSLNNTYFYLVSSAVKKRDQNTLPIEIEAELDGRGMFVVRNSRVTLSFLVSDGYRYDVEYLIGSDNSATLVNVSEKVMDSEEISRFKEHLSEAGEEMIEAEDESEEEIKDEEDEKEQLVRTPSFYGENPIITRYKKAILREKYYLQEVGGREYKVSNGRIISRLNGICTYSFEIETELFLSDDAPIKLLTGDKEANGNVVSCEEFQIIINVDKDLGLFVSQADIRVEPWKLLEAIANNLERISASNRIALKLVNEGPGLATKKNIDLIPKGQDAAIESARDNDITLIWGPPGTGKTYTMSKIALNAINENKSILVVSHSNVSVDGVVKAIVGQVQEAGKDNFLQDGKILRFGYVRDEELADDDYAVAYNYALLKRPELKKELDELTELRSKLKQNGNYNTSKGAEVENKLKNLRARVREAEKYYVAKANFVATTISKVTVDRFFLDVKYDVVMFDEVSMAYVPQILCAAMRARKRLVLVGDFKQLSPIVQSDAKETLSKDIFNFLGISTDGKMYAHPWLVMLNEQRRMYPEISAFPNRFVYNNLLKDHPSVWESRNDTISRKPFCDESINLLDLFGAYCATTKNKDNSRFNILSAVVSFLTALDGETDGQSSIGIITPYAAQTRLIRAMIQDHREKQETDIDCATVHQFQGSERDTIVFDAVESYPFNRAGFLMGKELESVKRLVNVAVTRAKGKLVVVTNSKFWESHYKDKDHVFFNLVQYLKQDGNVISAHEKKLQNYLMQLPGTKNIKNYQYEDEILKDFAADVAKAKDRIIISIPDGALNSDIEGQLFDIIAKAKENGITILSKTNGYEDLPDTWKSITLASDNTVFPVIMVDDRVMWYGLPQSKGRFKDGHSVFATTCPVVYRIRGEHTLEYIKAVAALDVREYDGTFKALQPKDKLNKSVFGLDNSTDESVNGYSEVGLAQFVSEVNRCPICRKPMALTKSARGKFYLKCSSRTCTGKAYLEKEVTNAYITQRRVKCPNHNCGLHSGVNKYGIYIKCEMGHYLQPDEI